MSEFIVHTIPGSPYARAVFVVLEEKSLPWRIAALAPGMTKAPAHLERHPFGRMPVLEHGDFEIYETQAIVRYIDRVQPQPSLTPADARSAARMDQLMNINDWYLFQGVNSVIGFQRIVGPRLLGITPDDAAIAGAMPKAQAVFDVLGEFLGSNAFFAGDHISLADAMLAPQLDFLRQTPEWEPLTANHANVREWMLRMNERPSMIATTWERIEERAKAA